jgi:uncharacterized protein (TIGR03083 family)
MDRDAYLSHVGEDGKRLIEVARTAPFAAIPSCPGWDMRALVGHVSSVHGWVADILGNQLQTGPHLRSVDELVGDFDAVAAGYDVTFDLLLAVLEAAGEEETVWNWSDRAPAPARFWFRRMAQETVVHRIDAELGARALSPIDAELAADGIGEFLGLLQRYIPDDPVEGLRGTIAFSASDMQVDWRLALAPSRIEFISGDVDATVRGPASDLYRWILQRDDGEASLEMSGDRRILELWRAVKFVGRRHRGRPGSSVHGLS